MSWETVAKKGGPVSPTGYVNPWSYKDIPERPASTPSQMAPTERPASTPSQMAPTEEAKQYSFDGGDYFGNIDPYIAPREKEQQQQPSYSKRTTPTSSRTTSYSSSSFTPTRKRPVYGDIPEYGIPERDEGRISELKEKAMGVPMSRLRRALNRALIESRYSTNPIVRAHARKQALSGYGEGIGEIQARAGREARAEYAPEYQAQVAKTAAEYAAKLNKRRAEFNADWQDYYQSGTKKQTSSQTTRGSQTNWVINPSFRS